MTTLEAPTHVADVGFTILSDPQDAVIDIVFVHGLQGHPQNTWTYKLMSARSTALSPPSKVSKSDKSRTFFGIGIKRINPELEQSEEMDIDQAESKDRRGQRQDVFWPRDLLKDDFPKARIMTFGYNTNITQGYHAAHQGNIFSHARDLLYGLEAKRRKAADRDLVFIAHSLGGILVKEVLRRSETDPDAKIKKIFTSTTGVFFFGTPHRGSKDWASFGEGVAGVAGRLLGMDTNNQIIHALLPSSPELELCRESFTTQWVTRGNSLVVRTFQESKGVTGVRRGGFSQLVVPPDSSSLDHPNQRPRTIDEDHIGMVKFKGSNDKAYEMVKADIEELVENSQAAKETRDATTVFAQVTERLGPPSSGSRIERTDTERAPSNGVFFPGWTILHAAVTKGDIEGVKAALAAGISPNCKTEDRAWTPLWVAACTQKLEIAAALLKAGADANAITNDGSTAINEAAKIGATRIVELLIGHGADLEISTAEFGESPLISAAYKNHIAAVRTLLIAGANVRASQYGGWTALHYALHNQSREMACLILEYYPNVNAATTRGVRALHLAAMAGMTRLASRLLDMGAEIDAVESGGLTALRVAVQAGELETSKMLVGRGARTDLVDGPEQHTLMDVALRLGYTTIYLYLQELSAISQSH